TDIFGRFGGEEFMIIMPDTPEAVAVDTAERLCRLVQNLSVSMDDTDIRFTVSIGVAGTWNGCGPDLNAIAHKADKALYEAKQNGRNQVVKSLS
ncbi:MAG TPA: diguanylate cyclase response regulator, partial [Desulfobacteraceae bacterium]|nr:diguanylate cyclase response regulator [Desulfobacteraceae bacterium]